MRNKPQNENKIKTLEALTSKVNQPSYPCDGHFPLPSIFTQLVKNRKHNWINQRTFI